MPRLTRGPRPGERIIWTPVQKPSTPSVTKSTSQAPAATKELEQTKTDARDLADMLKNREQQEKAPADLTSMEQGYIAEQRARFARSEDAGGQ